MEITNKKIFYINSRNRITGNDSDFTYNIDLGTNGHEFNKVCLLDCNIPKSYYLVPSGSTFILKEQATETTITVDPGNYTRSNFKTYIQSKLNSSSAYSYVYTVTYTTAPDNGKYVFSVSNNSGNQPSLIFSSSNGLFEQFGFDSGSTNVFTANSLTSTNVVKFSAEDTLYLHCDMVSNGSDNVLHEFFVSSSSDFSSISVQTKDIFTYSKDLTSNSNNVYRFYLTNEDDEPIDLNGLNINFVILVYRENRLTNILKKLVSTIYQIN